MVSHIIPPNDIIPLLEADMRGVAFERFLFFLFLFQRTQKKFKKKESESHLNYFCKLLFEK